MSDEIEVIEQYWRQGGTTDYCKPEIQRRRFLVNKMGEHASFDARCTVHELGSNVGSNLKLLTDTFTNVHATGNDIGIDATENSFSSERIKVFKDNTCDFLKKMEPVDYIITMAHIIHLPNEYDECLRQQIPLKFKDKLFLFEQNLSATKRVTRGDHSFDIKFPRDFDSFFPDLKLVERCKTGYSNYILWVYSK